MVESDEILALKCSKGELRAFEELVTRYHRKVYVIAYRLLEQPEEAEDVTQEVFLQVYRKIYQFDPKQKFAAWLYRITVNTCISKRRKKKNVVFVNFDEYSQAAANRGTNEAFDPLLNLELYELKAKIESALKAIPDKYRTIIILRYQLDLSNQEIADILGITKENVEVRIHRARKMLRSILLQNLDEGRVTNGL